MSMLVRVGLLVVVPMMFTRPVRVLVDVLVRVGMLVLVAVAMIVFMSVIMIVVTGVLTSVRANSHRILSRQTASAISTHQSTSNEATSISRPARISPLKA